MAQRCGKYSKKEEKGRKKTEKERKKEVKREKKRENRIFFIECIFILKLGKIVTLRSATAAPARSATPQTARSEILCRFDF